MGNNIDRAGRPTVTVYLGASILPSAYKPIHSIRPKLNHEVKGSVTSPRYAAEGMLNHWCRYEWDIGNIHRVLSGGPLSRVDQFRCYLLQKTDVCRDVTYSCLRFLHTADVSEIFLCDGMCAVVCSIPSLCDRWWRGRLISGVLRASARNASDTQNKVYEQLRASQ